LGVNGSYEIAYLRYQFKGYLTAEIAGHAEIIQSFFSAFSATSAVNTYAAFPINPAASAADSKSDNHFQFE
jgi:hypothetical protein